MNTATRPLNRDDLLRLLREACVSAAEMERRLRRLLIHEPPAAPSRKLETLLAETIEQQGLLRAAVSRIEDTPIPAMHGSPDTATAPISTGSGAGETQDARALLQLREDMLREAELYARLIETAESTGFFETKFVCEGILSRKSATFEWLGTQPSPAATRQQADR
ncbi:hypothetical protein [Burkholderia perseverans]|uniref:hypothetical protein n=1 Tax=Burkholderia perseverans TaxID=2615214 RepID=UPI001FEE298A|nr:hypothetical protein [Burkholderia perseverans]